MYLPKFRQRKGAAAESDKMPGWFLGRMEKEGML
jgi:hypothetical protein